MKKLKLVCKYAKIYYSITIAEVLEHKKRDCLKNQETISFGKALPSNTL